MSSPEIPALPPPLPTHTRSLSYSSSSSSAGSPAQQSGPFAQNTVRRSDSKGSAPLSRSGSQGFGGAGRRSGSSVSSSSPPLSRSSSFVRQGSNSPASQRSPVSVRRSPSTSDSPDPSASTSRHRASSILNKVSPSLSQSRYTSPPSNTTSVGLRSTNSLSKTRREPLGLGLGLGAGAFSRGMGQLPSPPHTASDGASTASNTIRSRDGLGSEHGSGGSAEPKSERPERPPKSEARSSLSTPPKRRTLPFDVPSIERSSPTVAGSPARGASPDRRLLGDASTSPAPATVGSSLRRSLAATASLRQSSGFDDPASPNSPTPSPRTSLLVDLNSSAGSESDASARTARDDGDVKNKRRAREASLEALEGVGKGGQDGRNRQAMASSELKVKNQRVGTIFLVSSASHSPSDSLTDRRLYRHNRSPRLTTALSRWLPRRRLPVASRVVFHSSLSLRQRNRLQPHHLLPLSRVEPRGASRTSSLSPRAHGSTLFCRRVRLLHQRR